VRWRWRNGSIVQSDSVFAFGRTAFKATTSTATCRQPKPIWGGFLLRRIFDMQSFLTSFSVSCNRRHGTSGHVFQGRYKAFLVEDVSEYAAKVSRYIHLNQVRVPSFEGAAVEDLQREMRHCRWSSYGAVIGLRRCPRWLKRGDVLRGWGSTQRDRQLAYAEYVEQGLTKDLWDPWEAAAAQAVIGSDSFVDRIRRGPRPVD